MTGASLDSLDLEVRQGENFGFLRREKAKYGPVGAQSSIKVVAVISVARVLKGAAVHK